VCGDKKDRKRMNYIKKLFVKSQCPICFEDIGNTNFSVTPCGHKFHTTCMVTSCVSVSSNFPLCRQNLNSSSQATAVQRDVQNNAERDLHENVLVHVDIPENAQILEPNSDNETLEELITALNSTENKNVLCERIGNKIRLQMNYWFINICRNIEVCEHHETGKLRTTFITILLTIVKMFMDVITEKVEDLSIRNELFYDIVTICSNLLDAIDNLTVEQWSGLINDLPIYGSKIREMTASIIVDVNMLKNNFYRKITREICSDIFTEENIRHEHFFHMITATLRDYLYDLKKWLNDDQDLKTYIIDTVTEKYVELDIRRDRTEIKDQIMIHL
jgi:hypothetical protein